MGVLKNIPSTDNRSTSEPSENLHLTIDDFEGRGALLTSLPAVNDHP